MSRPAMARRNLGHAALIIALIAPTACGGGPRPPVANAPAPMPDLSGQSVLLLPVHPGPVPAAIMTAAGDVRLDGVDELDAELAYWLKDRAANVKWVMPDAIDRMLARSPALDIKPRSLDIAVFRHTQVKRIGDPLFGDLKRLASVLNARYALVPIAAENKPGTGIEVAFALIDTTFGDVVWFGVLAGENATAAAQRTAGVFAPRRATSSVD
ncbi:MAG: hypothetical protein WEE89_04235 [Gemmatimonadota bacterium]